MHACRRLMLYICLTTKSQFCLSRTLKTVLLIVEIENLWFLHMEVSCLQNRAPSTKMQLKLPVAASLCWNKVNTEIMFQMKPSVKDILYLFVALTSNSLPSVIVVKCCGIIILTCPGLATKTSIKAIFKDPL